ncbi:MAG: 4-hydroxy-tetrahydrodipicolinate synthase [Proteobacteria bacterium]|nr:4-hydroxy-tetrahydrodipicolinate synthase [Pseudomonadota bacterium]
MNTGCYTALTTPFLDGEVDYPGLEKLVDFQIQNGISGILAVGTTGESPTLVWDDHIKVIENISKKTKNKCLCIAGTGSNNTCETLSATRQAKDAGVDAVLLVDPYYNGPSSIEIRKEYIGPVAEAFPDLTIIPYIIPGRTGTQLLPEDLAILKNRYKNVSAVKEATGNIENMRRTRQVCGPDFSIYSGDDAMVYDMMTDPEIQACGLISVASNIIPKFTTQLVMMIEEKRLDEASALVKQLEPLFNLTTVITREKTPYGEITCRARNPLGIKTAMAILGMPSGGCRKPLGKMTPTGLTTVLGTLKAVWKDHPHLLAPMADFFQVDIEKRLNDKDRFKDLAYTDI